MAVAQVPVITTVAGATPQPAAPVAVFGMSYTLANNIAKGAGVGTDPVAGVARGVYVWDAQWTGGGTLKLQALGADGTTWRDVVTLAAPGTLAGEIRIGADATLRVLPSAAVTGLYSVVS